MMKKHSYSLGRLFNHSRSGFILFFICFQFIISSVAHADFQNNVVRGLVKGSGGVAMEGVTVGVKDGSTTVTDANGAFSIEVPVNGVLVFSFTGYVSEEVNVGSRNFIELELKTDVKGLDEVVVVGYGTQKRRDVTGSVATVPRSRLDMVPNLNLAQALQGAVPGIMVQQTQAGAVPGQSIMVRGRNSILASNDPLLVVDGVPYSGNIMDINPNDISSMEVLKDASAAAIYGSRGANGVILITTRIGQTGKPRINYDGRYSTQTAVNVPKFMNATEFYEFKEIREPGRVTASEQDNYDNGRYTDWVDLALRNGSSHQHNLTVAGGFQKTNYLIGGSFLDVNGVAINDGYRRVTSRINVETEITDWLKVGTRTQLSFENKQGFPLDWTLVFRKNPLTRAYEDDGSLTKYPWPEFIDIRNPLEPINYNYSNQSNQILTNNFAVVKVPFIPGLTYQLNTGVRRKSGAITNYIGRNTAAGLEAGGIANTANTIEKNSIVENVLSYNRTIGDHTIFATAAYMYEKNSASGNMVDARGFPNDFTSYFATSQASFVSPSYTYIKTVLLSQMLRVNYSYKSRYLITLTGRRDGFSGFGANSKWGTFPSVALGWNLDDEKFFPWKDVISKFKLRLSYGLNGNQAVGAYETISRYAEYNIVSQGNTFPGYIPSRIGLDNLGWESSGSFNMGVDFGILNNRIEGDINYYRTNTYDLLLNRTISSANGLTSITQNIGETRNTGIEFSLNSKNIVTPDFTWNTMANFTHIKNEIVSLYGLLDDDGKEINDIANAWFIGSPVRVNYDFVFDGVWQQNEATEAATWGSVPGNAKIRDVNKDGVIDANDRQIIGQLDPKFMWGLTNAFSFRNFTLSIFVHGVHGVTRLNELLQDASASSDVRRNVLKKNWWTPENPTNEFYRNALNAERMSGVAAGIYENASFIRIKDLSLSYDVPASRLTKAGLQRMRLYVVARNLHTITNWTASDPELNSGRGTNPLQREFVFGLTLNF